MNSIQQIHGKNAQGAHDERSGLCAGPVINQYKSAHGDGDPVIAMAHRKQGRRTLPRSWRKAMLLPTPPREPVLGFQLAGLRLRRPLQLQPLLQCAQRFRRRANVSSIALVTFGDFEDSDVQAFFSYYGFAYDYNSYTVDAMVVPDRTMKPLAIWSTRPPLPQSRLLSQYCQGVCLRSQQ